MLFFVQVDCTSNTETCKHYGVTGYPTLKIFRNGQESSSYDGPRSAGICFKFSCIISNYACHECKCNFAEDVIVDV